LASRMDSARPPIPAPIIPTVFVIFFQLNGYAKLIFYNSIIVQQKLKKSYK